MDEERQVEMPAEGQDREPRVPEAGQEEAHEAAHDLAAVKVLMQSQGQLYEHLPTVVRAVKADREYRIATDHGVLTVEAGVWLMSDASGEVWPLRASKFEEKYRSVSG